MKTLYAILTAFILTAAISSASFAESGFGTGFTGDSPAAFTDTTATTEGDISMDDAAAAFNETEPAAGDEITTDSIAPMSETEIQIIPETEIIEPDSIDNVIIQNIHQE